MKKALIGAVAGIIITALFVSSVMSMAVALFPSKDSLVENDYENIDYENFEFFEATGTIEGNTVNLTLRNKRTGYTIDGIEFEVDNKSGTVVSYANMPKLTGTREKMAWQYLLRQGWTPEGAAGLLANIDHESGFDMTVIGDNGTSYGLCQWHAGRWDNLKKFLKEKGIDSTVESDELFLAQLEYAISEPGYEDLYNRMKHAKSAPDAARMFCKEYERPEDANAKSERRAVDSKKYYSTYKDVPAYEKNDEKEVNTSAYKVTFSGEYDFPKLKLFNSNGREASSYAYPQEMTFHGLLENLTIAGVMWLTPVTGAIATKDMIETGRGRRLRELQDQINSANLVLTGSSLVKGTFVVASVANTRTDVHSILKKIVYDSLNATPHSAYNGRACLWTSIWGPRRWKSCEFHHGLDFQGSPPGGLIYPIYAGEVVDKKLGSGYGNTISIETKVGGNSIVVSYCHLDDRFIGVGETALVGEPIGIEGNTGFSKDGAVHLHIMYCVNGEEKNPKKVTGLFDAMGCATCQSCINEDLGCE